MKYTHPVSNPALLLAWSYITGKHRSIYKFRNVCLESLRAAMTYLPSCYFIPWKESLTIAKGVMIKLS